MAIFKIGGISFGDNSGPAVGPLSGLYSIGTPRTYAYPEDLGSSNKMHMVKFSIYNIVPKKFASQTWDFVTSSADNTLSKVVTGTKNALDSVSSKIADSFSGAIYNPNDPTEGITKPTADPNEQTVSMQKLGEITQKVQTFITPEKRKTATEIFLYMPDTLAINYNNNYDSAELTELTGGMNRLVGAVGSIIDDYQKGGGSKNLKNVVFNAFDNYGAEVGGKVLDKAVGMTGNSSDFSTLLLKAQGKAVNPQLQLIYKGVGFREFQMTFIFTPKTQTESDYVTAIINAFVYASSPTVTPENGMYFIPPSIFNIQFLLSGGFSGQGKENDRIFKVGDCVLKDVNVDYAPNGWAAYGGGAPVQTTLTLSFMENQIIDRNRMLSGQVR